MFPIFNHFSFSVHGHLFCSLAPSLLASKRRNAENIELKKLNELKLTLTKNDKRGGGEIKRREN